MIPIFFIPGLLCDEALFAHQITALKAKGHECYVIAPTYADNMLDLGAGALQRIKDWGDPPKFGLVALSMGGYVAFEIIRQLGDEKDRVEKLVLMNTLAKPDTEEHKIRRKALIELSRTGRFKGVTPRLLPNLINANHLQNSDITDVIFDMAERAGRTVFEAQQMAIMNRQDSRDTLAKITQPTLVVAGADDKIAPPDQMAEMVKALPNATLHTLDDCGHLSPLEQATQVTKLLTEFMAKDIAAAA